MQVILCLICSQACASISNQSVAQSAAWGITSAELKTLLHSILDQLTADNNHDVDVQVLRELLTVITKLLHNVIEQLDACRQLLTLEKFHLNRFASCDDDIQFWMGFYSYDALVALYEELLEQDAGK